MHHLSIISLALLATGLFATLSNADCCLPVFDAMCADGTVSTPYCGYGPCNIFGCNCDGGCRRFNQNGFNERAMFDFGNCQLDGNSYGSCHDAYERKKASYSAQAGVAGRITVPSRISIAHKDDDPKGTVDTGATDTDNTFSAADTDGDGNLTLSEFINHVNLTGTSKGQMSRGEAFKFVQHFYSFDKNDDGIIDKDEVEG